MNIKNYTSSVPIDQSIVQIERLLIQAGATHIMKEFESDGSVKGLAFLMTVDGIPLRFVVPCDVKPIKEYMLSAYKKLTPEIEKRVENQAARTAWKMTHEWVHIQVSQVIVKRQEPLQVFLSYLTDAKGMSFYDHLKATQFKMLPSASKMLEEK